MFINLPLRTPHHRHDSETHRYRGSFIELTPRQPMASIFDVYVTEPGPDQGVILRYTSEGPDYASMSRRHLVKFADVFASTAFGHAMFLVENAIMTRLPRGNGVNPPDVDEPFTVKRWSTVDGDNNGGWRRYTAIIEMKEGRSIPMELWTDEWKARLHDYFPSTYCQHEHDCCGHYYARSAKFTGLPNGLVMVSQTSYQNV